ncbi:MAG: hypothetical protein RDU24_04125 [Humidesulfovibrio sp.]|uniref:hypothetical protein n=1 Tax=Humidesulfovibrio sp. TaxID=2910988 RepID=UPI0027FDC08D|nr:hypothetical protein [Humidesulfovibrio sp.]MDQ7834547.1 hypothetical protein [Humidesulfovibrio sp.]
MITSFPPLPGVRAALGRPFGAMLLLAILLTLTACGAMGPSWDEGKRTVKTTVIGTREMINPKPVIDVTRYGWDNPNREKLALLMAPVDAKVTELMRYVTSQDYRPDDAWMNLLMLRFPWIDGILIADANGDILERRPPVPVKRFSEPLVFESIWRETLVKTVVDYTLLGPEVYFGMPNYETSEFVGLHVVSFDPRILFSFCPHPDELFIVDPYARKIWSASTSVAPATEALTTIAWDKELLERSQGTIEAGGKYFTWLARYIGRDRFIYATESANASIEDKGLQLIPFFGSFK